MGMGSRPLLQFHLTNIITPCQVSSMALAWHILKTATPCILRPLQMGGLQVIHTDLINSRELKESNLFLFLSI
jgi:hypothetical protein